MVASDMGVGIVPLSTAREDVERGRLVRWWIEGVRINWELGVARMSGGYLSPVCRSFLDLCHEHFADSKATDDGSTSPRAASKRSTKKSAAKRGRKAKK
jgi:DNA-binding transcriptional LysR family regulator